MDHHCPLDLHLLDLLHGSRLQAAAVSGVSPSVCGQQPDDPLPPPLVASSQHLSLRTASSTLKCYYGLQITAGAGPQVCTASLHSQVNTTSTHLPLWKPLVSVGQVYAL